MADPLSLLRQYNVNKREILEKNDMICFGDYCWPKDVKTNYLIYMSSRDGPNKVYYTLECLLFFLKNIHLQHPTYVKQAASLKIPIVQRPDRKDLVSYLSGETAVSNSIDRSAPIELPKSVAQLLREGFQFDQSSASGHHHASSGSAHLDDGEAPSKLARLDEMEKMRKQFVARLDGPKMKKGPLGSGAGAGGNLSSLMGPPALPGSLGSKLAGLAAVGLDGQNSSTLRDAMSSDQIAALKAKRLAKKRSTIIDADSDMDSAQGIGLNNASSVHSVLLQYDANFTKEIQNKERVWRNRANILQSTGKNFQKTVFPLLQTIKVREEGGSAFRKPGGVPTGIASSRPGVPATPITSIGSGPIVPGAGGVPGGPPGGAAAGGAGGPQQYNRYDQERFSKNDAPIGFSIDTTSTYHGLTLKSVTEGSGKSGSGAPATASLPPPSAATSALPKAPLNVLNGANGPNGSLLSSSHHQSSTGTPKPQKRVSRTPIIIIPATNTSLITMYNAKAILQDLKFMDSKQCDQRRDPEVLIQRRKPDNSTVPYRIVDNPLKLSNDDWNRVVAVFVQGPAWQFKGWPWEGNPVEIFSRIKAFHLKFDEMKLDNNVAKWSVEIIELSRSKRHLDRANLLKFWSLLDQHIVKFKHNVVRF